MAKIHLTPPQKRLLQSIQNGAVIHYMDYDRYYYLENPFQRCTAQVDALKKKGLLRIQQISFHHRCVLLTEAGRNWK